jgi:hypothetical protein
MLDLVTSGRLVSSSYERRIGKPRTGVRDPEFVYSLVEPAGILAARASSPQPSRDRFSLAPKLISCSVHVQPSSTSTPLRSATARLLTSSTH